MIKRKPVLFFLLKAFLVFSLFALPLKIYNDAYSKMYRSISNSIFGKFHGTGFSQFLVTDVPFKVFIHVGNTQLKGQDGSYKTATSRVNIRYRGFLPTILFLSLLIATPIPIKRKIVSALIGFSLLTIMVLFIQWIHLLYMCQENKWLGLSEFSPGTERKIEFLYAHMANYNGTTMMFVVVIWLLTSFRKEDLNKLMAQ